VPAHGVGPFLDAEALEEAERPAVVDALQDPEQTAEVDEGRVDDHDAGSQPQIAIGIAFVVLGADEDP